ncbi:class I SAM-dependent methyltransferase [Massilia sp. BJB1822]|uniref:class I SAM-dependent methyltransferase n=1 Tax=Massilia sp. BJB1822 TaxID=2744470 RepID=UPI001593CF9D|nr:class I SAM-dependent methyltransferase [Massilia sp. BJB1822]NVD96503.1 methyltransferase regulatory domain-containing protein [Massilia sp. BJB1822]
MPDWSAGYVADIAYTYGTYSELSPMRARLAFLHAGLVFPEVRTCCELGFGQGMSINIHAASSDCAWYGTDFNPSQAGFAQELASASGAQAHLYDQAFAEFCRREDLPDFDSIGLHGIWTWISDENRAVIVDFIRRKLKLGGVLYISYNTQPGWAAMVPMRDLLTEYSQVMGAPGKGIAPRINDALQFAERLLSSEPAFLAANPQIAAKIEGMKKLDRSYLAHEYFNRDWLPMSFSSMTKWLEPAKLNFACSAHYMDHIDVANFSPEQSKILDEIADPSLRQTVRDFLVNQTFRRDYWVHGARQLSQQAQREKWLAQRMLLAIPRHLLSLKANTARGEVDLHERVYRPVIDCLADYQPKSVEQIARTCEAQGVTLSEVIQALFILAGTLQVQPVQDEDSIARARPLTDKLNRKLCQLAAEGLEQSALASPVTGSAVTADRFHQLFLLAYQDGQRTPQDWAHFANGILQSLGQRILIEGKAAESDQEQLAELERRAGKFGEFLLPIFKALGVAR